MSPHGIEPFARGLRRMYYTEKSVLFTRRHHVPPVKYYFEPPYGEQNWTKIHKDCLTSAAYQCL